MLQHLPGLVDRYARVSGRHVHQVALVQRRHELGTELRRRPQPDDQHSRRQHQRRSRVRNHRVDDRPIDTDQGTIDRIPVLFHDPAADEVAHQHRHERHRQPGRRRHGVGLGKRERREESSLLRLEREHGQKAERDDQQREEQRRSDFGGRLRNDPPAVVVIQRLFLDVLVHVFDHDDRGIDHGANRDSDPSQRHDVGVNALDLHDGKCGEDADRQAQYHDDGRAQVEQEHRADQRNDDEFLDQLALQRVHGPLDQRRAVIRSDYLDALRQAALEFGQPLLDPLDRRERVLAPAHDDDAADDFALAVQIGDSATHLWPGADFGDVRQRQRRTRGVDP